MSAVEVQQSAGLVAEFEDPHRLVEAIREVRRAGYRDLDALTPFPVDGVEEALELRPSLVPYFVLFFGLLGTATGYLLPWWISAVDYPINVGGRPFNSWPAWVPIMFELTVLFAGVTAFIAMLSLNGLPKPYHPLFNVSEFARATQDRFFLFVGRRDPRFEPVETRRLLENVGSSGVFDVPE